MRLSLTNLLPAKRAVSLRRAYYLRLAVVCALLLTGLVVVHAALLLPTHRYLAQEIATRQNELMTLAQQGVSADEAAFEGELSALSASAAQIAALGGASSASTILAQVLGVAHPSISIIGLTYTAPDAGKPGIVVVAGSATTRDALRAYQLALEQAPFVASADLPVSAYAKDTDIPFQITLTLVKL